MSTQKQLPDAWVDALFQRFTQVWGVQKVAAQYAPPEGQSAAWMIDLFALWGAQLGSFSGPTLKAALQAAIDRGSDWPPTLPEFKALCNDYNRPEQRPAADALPAPGQGHTDMEQARRNIERIKSMLSTSYLAVR